MLNNIKAVIITDKLFLYRTVEKSPSSLRRTLVRYSFTQQQIQHPALHGTVANKSANE